MATNLAILLGVIYGGWAVELAVTCAVLEAVLCILGGLVLQVRAPRRPLIRLGWLNVVAVPAMILFTLAILAAAYACLLLFTALVFPPAADFGLTTMGHATLATIPWAGAAAIGQVLANWKAIRKPVPLPRSPDALCLGFAGRSSYRLLGTAAAAGFASIYAKYVHLAIGIGILVALKLISDVYQTWRGEVSRRGSEPLASPHRPRKGAWRRGRQSS